MQERVENLLRIIKEDEVVKNISASDNPILAYETFAKKYEEKINELLELHEREDFGEKNFYHEITSDDAPSWCMIFIMTSLDEEDFGVDFQELNAALRYVKGDLAEIAWNMAQFVSSDCWSCYKSHDRTIELINDFFDV